MITNTVCLPQGHCFKLQQFYSRFLCHWIFIWISVVRDVTFSACSSNSQGVVSDVRGVFRKRPTFLNSAPTSTKSALRLLSASSVRFWQQTAICPVSLWALIVELHPLSWAVHKLFVGLVTKWQWKSSKNNARARVCVCVCVCVCEILL
jgi:hypothetical protein